MDAAQLVERYLDTWNEADPSTRLTALAEVWADDASYVDPLASVAGHYQISNLIGAVQEQAPSHVFRLLGNQVDAHHNVVRFSWELVPEAGGESVAIGFDVVETDDDGRIARVVGFLDKAPSV
ncbi:MAG TPA: nuclear transport factor 2 family protein [Gaiellaceae bacterium]|jgi:ketosteroid isomerase-like protein